MSRTSSRRTEPQRPADSRLREEWAHTTGPQPTRDFEMRRTDIPEAFRRTGDMRAVPAGPPAGYRNPDGTISVHNIHAGAVPVTSPAPPPAPAQERRSRTWAVGRTPIAEEAQAAIVRAAEWQRPAAPEFIPAPETAPEAAPEPLRVHETWLRGFLLVMADDAAEGALRETGRECRGDGPDDGWHASLARAARYARLKAILESVSTDQAAAGVLAAMDWRGADADGAA